MMLTCTGHLLDQKSQSYKRYCLDTDTHTCIPDRFFYLDQRSDWYVLLQNGLSFYTLLTQKWHGKKNLTKKLAKLTEYSFKN